jgi:hypothetical protein
MTRIAALPSPPQSAFRGRPRYAGIVTELELYNIEMKALFLPTLLSVPVDPRRLIGKQKLNGRIVEVFSMGSPAGGTHFCLLVDGSIKSAAKSAVPADALMDKLANMPPEPHTKRK